jgi:hypothetical protein
VTGRELLERAIAFAHLEVPDPLRCLECGCDAVFAEYRPGLGWIPVSCHYAPTLAGACPVLSGGVAAWAAHEDLWQALAPYLFLAHYGEAADVAVVNAGLAAL